MATLLEGIIDECLFVCLTMESLWNVDRDVSTVITASLYQAMSLINVSLM